MKIRSKNLKTTSGMTLLEVTGVIALMLGLISLALYGMFSYSEHKDQQVMTAMLREVYTAQLKVVNSDPEGTALAATSGGVVQSRALVASELLPMTSSDSSTPLIRSIALRTNYQYTKGGVQYAVWVPGNLRQPPVWATFATALSVTPTTYDPSPSTTDGKYDVGKTAGATSNMP